MGVVAALVILLLPDSLWVLLELLKLLKLLLLPCASGVIPLRSPRGTDDMSMWMGVSEVLTGESSSGPMLAKCEFPGNMESPRWAMLMTESSYSAGEGGGNMFLKPLRPEGVLWRGDDIVLMGIGLCLDGLEQKMYGRNQKQKLQER